MQAAEQIATEPFFVDGGTNLPTREQGLSPRDTRYGFRPIWDITDLPGGSFRIWVWPANIFRAINLFQERVPTATNYKEGELVDRTPAAQVSDLLGYGHFLDLVEVAALGNPTEAQEIFRVLTNPNICPKYGFDLKNKCATCWLNYLRTEFVGSPNLSEMGQAALAASRTKMIAMMDGAVNRAIAMVDQASADIANDNNGKKTYQPVDFLNIMHTHNAMPEYKTANPTHALGDAIGQQIAKALATTQTPTVPQELMDQIAALTAQVEALKGAKIPEVEDTEIAIDDMVETDEGIGIVTGRRFGRVQIAYEGGATADIQKALVKKAK